MVFVVIFVCYRVNLSFAEWFVLQGYHSAIGPLHDPVTWYKITYTGEQIAQWDFQNKGRCIVLEVPLRNLLTSIFNLVPCDRVVQRAYYERSFVVSLLIFMLLLQNNRSRLRNIKCGITTEPIACGFTGAPSSRLEKAKN